MMSFCGKVCILNKNLTKNTLHSTHSSYDLSQNGVGRIGDWSLFQLTSGEGRVQPGQVGSSLQEERQQALRSNSPNKKQKKDNISVLLNLYYLSSKTMLTRICNLKKKKKHFKKWLPTEFLFCNLRCLQLHFQCSIVIYALVKMVDYLLKKRFQCTVSICLPLLCICSI